MTIEAEKRRHRAIGSADNVSMALDRIYQLRKYMRDVIDRHNPALVDNPRDSAAFWMRLDELALTDEVKKEIGR
ncbi:MAG: hypothetical protein KAY22_22855 [Rhizorhabdus sp.]|uniref:hypothetical protein n=1 Tax=Rhizorhabdus sp. TaxID=1968843 RepID=UPI001B4663AF|nr:hypothetical protein [Rhizorhabdus sp.]MBP8235142.1 hypothetical protein [Rhizorhabdus sp.]